MIEVLRHDTFEFELKPSVRMDEGYLLCEATAAAPGVLRYMQRDGSVRRELVLPETLNNADTLGSLMFKPVTIEHPKVQVNVDNVSEHGVGKVVQVAYEPLGNFAKVGMLIDNKDAIARIDSEDTFRGTSPAYLVQLDETPGLHPDFGRYDAIQVARLNNHFALTVAPRGGFDRASFRVDSLPSGAAVMLPSHYQMDNDMPQRHDTLLEVLNRGIEKKVTDERSRADIIEAMAKAAGISASTVSQILRGEIDTPPMKRIMGFARVLGISEATLERELDRGDADPSGVTMPANTPPANVPAPAASAPTASIQVDGVGFNIDANAAVAIAKERKDQGDEMDALKAKLEEMTKERDTLKGQLETLQSADAGDGEGDGDDGDDDPNADSDEARLAWHNARVKLDAMASQLKLDSYEKLGNAALMRSIVEAYRGDALSKDASDAEVVGAFGMVEHLLAKRGDSIRDVEDKGAKGRKDGDGDSRADAIAKYEDKRLNSWKPSKAS